MSDLYNYKAAFIRAVDGDTVEVEIDLGFGIHHVLHVRLAGVNTPEHGQPGYKEAKDYVQHVLSGTLNGEDFPLKLKTVKVQEKYGRYLAFIDPSAIAPGITNISESIIQAGHGVAYFGGKRE